jgi:hypothetical protein
LGGGPQSIGPEFSSPRANDAKLTLPATPPVAQVRPIFSRKDRRENPDFDDAMTISLNF